MTTHPAMQEVVILCHGMADNREAFHFPILAETLARHGISSFCFDFPGNGDSQGTFKFGNMKEEVGIWRSLTPLHTTLRHP